MAEEALKMRPYCKMHMFLMIFACRRESIRCSLQYKILFRGPTAKLITKDSVREGLLNGELEICKKIINLLRHLWKLSDNSGES